jgi:hypothetical protein
MTVRGIAWGIVLVVVGMGASGAACAEDLEQLKAQVAQVQAENRVLREQVNRQGTLIDQLAQRLEALGAPAGAAAGPQHAGPPDPRAFTPRLDLRGFTDLTFRAGDVAEAVGDANSTFALGQFDLFITSKLSDQLSFLAETVIEFSSSNAAVLDLERVQLQYAWSDLLNFRVGRMHTPLGYWNETFHHGSWFQTTAFRPDMDLFEDDGGIRPVHSVGVTAFGVKDFGAFEGDYSISVLNGRGNTIGEIQNVKDRNDEKAVNLLVGVAPERIPGLKLGWHTYLDTIPPDATSAARDGDIDELILGGYLTYLRDNIEVLAEVSHIHHDDEVSQRNFDTKGLYLQGAYQLTERWKPYYRFDLIDFGKEDPFFAPNAIDVAKHTAGLRWDPFTWNALKLEYSFSNRDNRQDTHAVTLQSAFAF